MLSNTPENVTGYILRESLTTQNVLWSCASVCVSVCLSVAVRPHYCTDPDVTWGHGGSCPLVVHYWADLQSGHGLHCYGNNANPSYKLACTRSMPSYISRVVNDAKCIVVTGVCVSVSVRGRMPTVLHGPGCNLGAW